MYVYRRRLYTIAQSSVDVLSLWLTWRWTTDLRILLNPLTERQLSWDTGPGWVASLALVLFLPDRSAYMREQARREFETKYTREQNYGQLMQIYDRARASGTERPPGDITPNGSPAEILELRLPTRE